MNLQPQSKQQQNNQAAVTNDSLFALRNVAQPQFLDGRCFFIRTAMNRSENRYETQILEYLNTGEIKRWGDRGTINTSLTLSPDGRYLAFVSNASENGKLQLCVQYLIGGSAVCLTDEPEGVSSFRWSVDSSGLYYQTQTKEEPDVEQAADDRVAEQFSSNKEKEKDWPQPTVITKKQYKFDGAGFLPEGRQYQVRYVDLTVMLTWQAEAFPTDRRPDTDLVMALNHSFSLVFADETCLLYEDHADPQDEWSQENVIYRYDRTDRKSRVLLTVGEEESVSFLGVSPSREVYILAVKNRRYGYLSYPQIYAYQPENGQKTLLNEGVEIDPGDSLVADFQQQTRPVELLWLSETQFLILACEHGKTVLYRADTTGSMEKVLDQRLHLTGAVLADDDRLLITYSTLTVPSRLAMLRLSSGEIKDLYDPNRQFCLEHRIIEPEMFYYKGYADWDIQAWYLAPTTDENRHPAVLYIHGGPQVTYGESFFHEMQALAAAGYGVMMINPRGGSSYGQQFVASILGDYGNHDYDDLMIGVDEMLKRYPSIDPNRLFVVGGSYGGFMTNWIVTHTDRFRAAVTQRSISNWLSFYGTSDIGVDFVRWQLQHELPDTKRLWEMSPLAHAAQAKTPLLVLHSDEDHRCPKEQGEQMYMAMKKYGVETKMITFPKSSHGLSRTGLPNLRQERLAAIRDWFDAHGGCNNT